MQGGVGIALVEARGGAAQHQPGSVEFGRHVGELELKRLEIGEPLPELAPLQHVIARRLRAGARAAERAGADIETAAVEPYHRDREALALLAEPVGYRDPTILEIHHRGRLGMPAELLLLLPEGKSRGVVLDDDAGDAAGTRLARADHRHVEIAATAAGDEGLGAVEHVIVVVAPGAG